MSTIAYFGLGVMGQGMVQNLAKAGHTVKAWTRSGAAHLPQGVLDSVTMCASPQEALPGADFVMYCMSDDAAVDDLMFGTYNIAPDIDQSSIVIDLSTIDPLTTQREAEALAARGIQFLDAPVFGSRGETNAGGLWIVVGGDRATFDAAKPVLEPISETLHYMGATGMGTSMKLVGNLLVASQLEALGEALVLASKAGLNLDDVIGVLDVTDFKTPIYSGVGRGVRANDYSVNFALKLMLKDADLITAFADRLDSPIPATAATREQIKNAIDDGYGDLNASALLKSLAARANVSLEA
jgi:3-hydroxyisobutyrate dehydrogenase-like beta-hydroxyacid dehydrogenase